jgi:16S rRNA (guanine527-N7)-methyltransferase
MSDPRDKVIAALEQAAQFFAVQLTDQQRRRLTKHFELLIQWNQKFNLSAIRQVEEIAYRHFGESLFLSTVISAPAGLMVDVGSGAGFPGLPLKVMWATPDAVLMEPIQKKATFLKEVIRQCELGGTRVVTERLETAAGTFERQADLVTMRAVAVDEALLQELSRLIGKGGRLALFIGNEDARRLSHSRILNWQSPIAIPDATNRVILLGQP